jgi:hypothetical protein
MPMREHDRDTERADPDRASATRSTAEGESQKPEQVVDPDAARRPEPPGTAALGSEGGAGSTADMRPQERKKNA